MYRLSLALIKFIHTHSWLCGSKTWEEPAEVVSRFLKPHRRIHVNFETGIPWRSIGLLVNDVEPNKPKEFLDRHPRHHLPSSPPQNATPDGKTWTDRES